MKLRASSLSYAIVFVTIGAMILMSLILMIGYKKEMIIKNDNALKLQQFGYSCSDWFLDFPSDKYVNEKNDTCFFETFTWGAYQLLNTKTGNSGITYKTASFFGLKDPEKYSLFIREGDRRIKLGGTTRISGDVKISRLGFERAYIASKRYKNDQLLYGENEISEKQMPVLSDRVFSLEAIKSNVIPIDFLKNPKKENSFTNKTIWLQSKGPIELNDTLKGRFLVQSFDSIYIRKDAVLEDVILQGTKIYFEEGFKGTLQVLAHQKIVVGKGVKLGYPSSLVLREETYNRSEESSAIMVDENAIVIGGVLLYSLDKNFRKPTYFDIKKNVKIIGLVYNEGLSNLTGEIIGTGIFNEVCYKSKGGNYQNTLVDVKISQKKLPKDFVYPSFLERKKTENYARIKWL